MKVIRLVLLIRLFFFCEDLATVLLLTVSYLSLKFKRSRTNRLRKAFCLVEKYNFALICYNNNCSAMLIQSRNLQTIMIDHVLEQECLWL